MAKLVGRQLLRELERQKFTWRKSKSGHVLVYGPDGRLATTYSDAQGDSGGNRNLKNIIAQLRRAGFVWQDR
jgi:hypothetical protein